MESESVDTLEKHLNQKNGNEHVDQEIVKKLNRLEEKLDKLENKEITFAHNDTLKASPSPRKMNTLMNSLVLNVQIVIVNSLLSSLLDTSAMPTELKFQVPYFPGEVFEMQYRIYGQ